MDKTTTLPITNILIWIARIFTGALFVFSGLIKANDPLGFSYKLEEYFQVFQMDFLNSYSVIIAILLCSIEIILGALLLIGVWKRQVVLGLLLLILFFTFLTFYSAFFEVVTSCGCFGDAIPLTLWQSFTKDLILLTLIIFLYINRNAIQPTIGDAYTKNIVTAGVAIISIGIGIYTFNFLPVLDFLPYKVGNNLPELMRIPPGAVLDEYETRYKLKNKLTNEEREMSDKEYLKT
ncbi:MAG TPA: BT_3928 family protein, partial [Sphingobacteriaceae bacterium]|nr:BT_3928 family protein [Sphingobacteriaceae bacterium]